MLLNHRPAIFVAVVAASLTAVTPPVEAGWLCDWLFSHHAPAIPVAPVAAPIAAPVAASCQPSYSAGFAPVAAAPAPTAAAPAEASYSPPVTSYSPPVTSYSPPATSSSPAVTSYSPPVTSYSPPVNDSGASAAQMPSYAAAMPAALPTGYAGVYSSYYGATPQQAAVAPAPVTSFYGNGNIYPDAHAASPGVVTANYAPAPQAIVNPQPRHSLFGGISRFFGHVFGTNYQTSYYRVPVTQYRPVTVLSPTTGAASVVQQPCTTYQNQVQRTPISSFQGATAAPNGCSAPAPLPATMAPANGYQAAPTGGAEGYVPQPTLSSDAFDPYASQRPGYGAYSNGTQVDSTYAPSNSDADCPPANASPLTGAPSNQYDDGTQYNGSQYNGSQYNGSQYNGSQYNGSQGNGSQGNGSVAPGDQQPVEQPQFDAAPSAGVRSYRQLPEQNVTANGSSWRSTAPVPAASRDSRPPRSARPIPAPRSTWPTPAESDDDTSGRTVGKDTWSTKKIQWATYKQASQSEQRDRDSRAISEPSLTPSSEVRRANHIAEPVAANEASQPDQAWQSAVPRRALEKTPQRPAPVPRNHRERHRYDDSGWE